MVTLSAYGGKPNRNVSEIAGLSTDTKPTETIEGIGIANGSTYIEMDTAKVYIFDEENKLWYEM